MCGASIQSHGWQSSYSGVQTAATILNWQSTDFNKTDELQNIRISMRLKTIPPIQTDIHKIKLRKAAIDTNEKKSIKNSRLVQVLNFFFNHF